MTEIELLTNIWECLQALCIILFFYGIVWLFKQCVHFFYNLF